MINERKVVIKLSSRLVLFNDNLKKHPPTFAAGDDRDIARPRANVVDDGPLYPGNEEVGALADDGVLDAGEAVEDDSSRATVDCCDRGKRRG